MKLKYSWKEIFREIFQIIVFECNLHALMELSKLSSQARNAADIWPKVWGHFRLGNSLLQRKLLLRSCLLYLKAKREWKTFDHFLGLDFFPVMFWHPEILSRVTLIKISFAVSSSTFLRDWHKKLLPKPW